MRASAAEGDRLIAAAWPERDRLLSLAFNSARDMMLLARVEPGPTFRVLAVNRQYLETVRSAGYAVTEEDFAGKTFAELRELFRFPEENWALILSRFTQAVRTRRALQYDEVTPTPKGVFYGDTTLTPVFDETGACILVLYSSADVTDRRRAEQALRDSEEKFSKAFRASPGAMAISEPGGAGFLEVNDGYVRMFGYAREELLGHQISEFGIWSSDAERTRFLEVFRRQGFVRDMEVVRRRKDGMLITCLLNSEPLELGGRHCILSSLYDVTARRTAEQALSESEEKFAKAFRASPGAMGLAELDGRGFVEVNDGYVRMFGYAREELVGRQARDLGLWAAPEQRAEFLRRLDTDGAVRELEVQRRRKDGTEITCVVSAETIELGGRRCVITAFNDITARRRAERALRDSEEKFSKAFRATPDALFITELESGRVVDANEGCQRVYGWSREECVGRTTVELGVWDNSADRHRMVDGLRASGGVLRGMELQGRTRDGRVVDVLVSADVIELDGRPHLVTIAHDITARKLAEWALRESEAKFSQAFRASPGAMGISEVASRQFIEVNDGYCRLFGYSREEMIGRTPLELNLWGDLAERERFVGELLAHGSVGEMEIVGRRKDGELVNCLLRAESVQLDGRPHFVTALHDITARKRAEAARAALEAQLRQAQKLDALGQLAGGIAHDFNNILTGIIAYSELALIDAERPAEVRKHLATVRKAAGRASDLVRQILTFSRKQAHEHRPTALPAVVREALKLLRSSLPRSIEFVEQIDPATPLVLADPTQIHQVVMNLCTNAAHAIRDRPGRLTVALQPLTVGAHDANAPAGLAPGRYARLTVSDTGHGMDEATMARIFDPFFTTKGPGEGTGLGLAVVHGIVEDHDGRITVRSLPGMGATFEVFLPEIARANSAATANDESLPRGAGQRLLLIDDEAVVASAAGEILRRLGYRVTAYTDPRQAWRAFEGTPDAFDLVLSDLTMPHLDGPEIVQRVHARRPTLPVLVMTGHSGAWDPESIRALGARDLVLKPLTSARLARAVHAVFAAPAR